MRLVFWFLCFSVSLVGKPLTIDVLARSAIVMNADTGAILYEKNAHLPVAPASTTKIATALYVLEKQIPLDRMVTISAESLRGRPLKDRDHPYWLDSEGTMMGIKRGETLTIESLLHGLMLVSGNDAANAIAESIGGAIPPFMDELNAYLQSIGCHETQFRNPHGLTHPEHYSTAYDMALIARRALGLPSFRKLVATSSYPLPKTNKQPPRELHLTNPLLNPKSRYYYPKAIGIKTGYTAAAQGTLVAAATHQDRTLIAVLLGSEVKGQRFEDAKRLFEAAFAEPKEKRRLIGPESLFAKEIVGAKMPLKAAVAKEVTIEYFPAEEPKCKAALHWNLPPLPIRKGQKVGEVQIQDENGLFLQKGDLVALEEVKGSFFFVLKQKLFR